MIIVILISIQRINNLVKVVIKIDVNFNQIHIRIMGWDNWMTNHYYFLVEIIWKKDIKVKIIIYEIDDIGNLLFKIQDVLILNTEIKNYRDCKENFIII